jgi:type I restriction enzyme S subunit
MPDWPEVGLGDLTTFKHGWPFKSELFSEQLTGLPIVVAVGNFRYTGGFRFNETSVKEYRGSYPAEYELAQGDILLVMTCQTAGGEILGIPATVPNDGHKYLHNQRLGKLVLKRPDLVTPRFLYWLFLSREFNRELFASSTGTKIVHTAPSRMEAFRFRLPPLKTQEAIANLLDALEAKVELNRRMNETLEAMGRALFKNWFVDIEGLPKGWREEPLGAHVTLQRGNTYKSALLGMPGPYLLGLASIARDGGFRRDKLRTYGGESPEKLLVQPGELYLSLKDVTQSGDLLGSVARVPRTLSAGRLTQDTVKLSLSSDSLEVAYLYHALLTNEYRAYCRAHAIGTTNLSLSREDLFAYPLTIPPKAALSRFSGFESALSARQENNDAQSRTLDELRTLLLPRLLSGELRIRDAEREIEAVA